MIALKLNCSQLDKAHLFAGKKGKYADLILMDNRDGTDQYGNDGFVIQGVSKEARQRGEKGPIVGNWKIIQRREDGTQQRPAQKTKATTAPDPLNGQPEEDDVPF